VQRSVLDIRLKVLADVIDLHWGWVAIPTEAGSHRWSSLSQCGGAGLAHVEAGHGLIVAVFRKLLLVEVLLGNGVEITEGPLVVTKTRHILHRRGDFTGHGSTLLHNARRHVYEIDIITILIG